MIGQTISHYKILEKIGGGGMGVVYKAEDTKLKRTVALKFLPSELMLDPEVKERFIHEAQAASSLDHHNICTVHEIGESDDGRMFIAMACYDGETLKRKIEDGRLKIEEATNIAIQISQGLSKAHESGIIHRDLKPANIMVTKDGVVKIVDFGLAKLSGATKLTKTNSTLGTLAYMAPEQLQNSAVDARADIFSLGVVLYEMLAGKTPFHGEHEAAMMYSIMNEEPEPLQTHVPDVTSEMVHIVNRALEKDPVNRYRSMEDVVIDLQRVKRDTSKVFGSSVFLPARHRFSRRKKFAVGMTTTVVLLAAVAAVFVFRDRTPRLNAQRTAVKIKVPPGFEEIWYGTLSQDGNWYTFPRRDENGRWDMYMMNISEGNPRRITNESYRMIFGGLLSQDAGLVIYSSISVGDSVYRVRIVSSQGGMSRTLADTGIGAVWARDGQRIQYLRCGLGGGFASRSGKYEIWSVNPNGSDLRREFIDTLNPSSWPLGYSFSPDGKSVVWARGQPTMSELVTRDLASGKEHQLTFDGNGPDEPRWLSNGMITFVSKRSGQTNLWMIPASGGDPIQITSGHIPVMGYSLSSDYKTLVYNQREYFGHVWITDLDGSHARQLTKGDVYIREHSVSPDGRQIALTVADVDQTSKEVQLFLVDGDGKDQRQLTSGSVIARDAQWSPDGKWLAYRCRYTDEPADSIGLYVIEPLNPVSPRLLCRVAGTFCWIDREKIAVYNYRKQKTFQFSLKGDPVEQVYRDSTFATPINGGRDIYYIDVRRGRIGTWIVPVDASGKERGNPRKVSSRIDLIRSPDNRFLLYLKSTHEGNVIQRVWMATGKEERLGVGLFGWIEMSQIGSDGKHIYWVKESFRASLGMVKDVFE